MQTIKTHKTQTTIQGVQKDVLINVQYEVEELDTQWMEKEDVDFATEAILSGKVLCVYIMVTAQFTDLPDFSGYSSIGQVTVRTKEHVKDIIGTVQMYQLESEAIKDLEESVLSSISRIQNFLTKGA